MAVIGISGSYGGLNLGDEAILSAIVPELRAAVPGAEIVVFSRDAEHTRRHHPVDRVVSPRTALREEVVPEVGRLDLLLLGGGGILYDSEAKAYLREVSIAHERGIPTVALAIGVGPLADVEERQAVREGLEKMAGITVREVGAKRLLQQIGLERPVVVTADPAFLLEPEPFPDEMMAAHGIPAGPPLVGLSVREQGAAAPDLDHVGYHRLLADAADFAVRRFDCDIVFVPMEASDIREAHRVIGEMAFPQRAHLLPLQYRPQQVLGFVARLRLAVGMRLHFLIFAALGGVPLMALPYAGKVSDLIDALGLPARPAVPEEHAGALLADLDRLWDHRREMTRRLAETVPRLRAAARRTVPLAVAAMRVGTKPEEEE